MPYISVYACCVDFTCISLAMAEPLGDSLALEEGDAKVIKPKRNGFVQFFLDNWFMITTIIGVVLGFGIGFALQKMGLSQAQKIWLGAFI